MITYSDIKETLIFLSGFLTPIIAIVTVYIAVQQYKTAKARLKFDLYEKRFKVYSSLMRFVSSIARTENVEEQELLIFYRTTNESYFFFDKSVNKYIEEIHIRAAALLSINNELNKSSLSDSERIKNVDNRAEYLVWFKEQLTDAKKYFYKYLKLDKS